MSGALKELPAGAFNNPSFLRGLGSDDFIVVGKNVANSLMQSDGVVKLMDPSTLNPYLSYYGTKIYIDESMSSNKAYVGKKGANLEQPGYKYMPYVPMTESASVVRGALYEEGFGGGYRYTPEAKELDFDNNFEDDIYDI